MYALYRPSLNLWQQSVWVHAQPAWLFEIDYNLDCIRTFLLYLCFRHKLFEIAYESWGLGDDETRHRMSVMASAAAWGLGQWDSMEEYVKSIPQNTMEGAFFQSLMHIHHRQFNSAQKVVCETLIFGRYFTLHTLLSIKFYQAIFLISTSTCNCYVCISSSGKNGHSLQSLVTRMKNAVFFFFLQMTNSASAW